MAPESTSEFVIVSKDIFEHYLKNIKIRKGKIIGHIDEAQIRASQERRNKKRKKGVKVKSQHEKRSKKPAKSQFSSSSENNDSREESGSERSTRNSTDTSGESNDSSG